MNITVTVDDIKTTIENIYKSNDNYHYSLDIDDRDRPMHMLYYQIYGSIGHIMSLDPLYDLYLNSDDTKDFMFQEIDKHKTLCNIVNYLNDNNISYYLVRKYAVPYIFTVNGEIIYEYMNDISVICIKPELPEWILKCVEKKEDSSQYKYVVYDQCDNL